MKIADCGSFSPEANMADAASDGLQGDAKVRGEGYQKGRKRPFIAYIMQCIK